MTSVEILRVPSLTRLSRQPEGLAVTVGRLVAADTAIVTPNAYLSRDGCGRREPLLPAPSALTDSPAQQASQHVWHNSTGLSGRHAAALGVRASKRHQSGRNDPCPCGSGRKYKRCCG